MLKKFLLFIGILFLPVLSGCWDLKEITASSISTGVGIELEDDDRITFSAQLIRPLPPGEIGSSKVESVVTSASDYGVAIAARRFSLSLSKIPEWAHVKTFILGEKLCGKDLSLAIDFMTRNRNIRPDINLMVASHTTPEELLSSQLSQTYDLGSGLNDLLTLSEKQLGIYVPTTMGEFTYKLTTPGIEPVVPQLTLQAIDNPSPPGEKNGDKKTGNTDNKKSKIILNGMAVFKGKRMAGSLNEIESRGYRWLNSSNKGGGLFQVANPSNNNEHIGLEIIHFSSKTRPQFDDDGLKMIIDVNAELGFYEQDSSNQLYSLEIKKDIEKAAGMEIKKQITACINKSQNLKSDILGWGQTLQQSRPNEWKQLSSAWPEQFPLVESEINVKTNLKRSMLIDKSFQFK
ncbi:MAG: Ger(x)C family spore germination protein [Syntrophomonadaceae bacterium]|nr:Ger(x)C family spore germination protein [Syntrophomonadaceae bacterium]